MTTSEQHNEGEGNRAAAQEYNQRTEEFTRETDVDKLAREAAQALDGAEGQALRAAEQTGLSKVDRETLKVEREA